MEIAVGRGNATYVGQVTKRFFNADPHVAKEEDVTLHIIKARRGFIVERTGWTERPNKLEVGRFKTQVEAEAFVDSYRP